MRSAVVVRRIASDRPAGQSRAIWLTGYPSWDRKYCFASRRGGSRLYDAILARPKAHVKQISQLLSNFSTKIVRTPLLRSHCPHDGTRQPTSKSLPSAMQQG